MPNTIYIDHTNNGDGPFGVIFAQETKVVHTGTEITTEKDSDSVREVSRLCGLHFFLGEGPEPPFYSVPYLEVFASDGQGGWFAVTAEREGPVYYIAPDHTPHLAADRFEALLNLAVTDPDWRQKRLPGGPWPRLPEDPDGRQKLAEELKLDRASQPEGTPYPPPELFASRAEAEKAYPILDFWTVLRQEKTPRFQIHPMMSPQDREGRAQVHYQAWQETYPGLMPESVLSAHTLARCRERSNDRQRANSTNTFVALDRENGDRVVGFGTLSHFAREFVSVPDAGEVTALYVLREFQGCGIGRGLLEHCLAWLPRPRAALFVLKGNDKAIGFYQHMGFRLTGHEITQDGMTELEMVLEKESAGT